MLTELPVLEHYFASKSFAAAREALSSACSDKEEASKTVHRTVFVNISCSQLHSFYAKVTDRSGELHGVGPFSAFVSVPSCVVFELHFSCSPYTWRTKIM